MLQTMKKKEKEGALEVLGDDVFNLELGPDEQVDENPEPPKGGEKNNNKEKPHPLLQQAVNDQENNVRHLDFFPPVDTYYGREARREDA